MKKLLTVAILATSFFSSAAIAKTEGHYVGLNVIRSSMEPADFETFNGSANRVEYSKDNEFSLGFNYKYAFNFYGVFVAPGVFFDVPNTSSRDEFTGSTLAFSQEIDLNRRYGLKLDVGYDIFDKFAAYGNIALVNNDYKYRFNSVAVTGSGTVFRFDSRSDSDISVAYGVGVKYSVLDNLDLSLEYEISEFQADTSVGSSSATQDVDLEVMKLGVSYKF